jgi:hypothetical protein
MEGQGGGEAQGVANLPKMFLSNITRFEEISRPHTTKSFFSREKRRQKSLFELLIKLAPKECLQTFLCVVMMASVLLNWDSGSAISFSINS